MIKRQQTCIEPLLINNMINCNASSQYNIHVHYERNCAVYLEARFVNLCPTEKLPFNTRKDINTGGIIHTQTFELY